MKKKWIIVSGVFVFLIVSLIALPFIFKGKILERIDKEVAESVNAKVYYDYDNISLSLFRRFPNISASIGDFGIVGNAPFENDTLVQLERLDVDFNLSSVLFDDSPQLTGLRLDGGELYVKILEDGTANYDITVPTEEKEVAESNFKIGVDLIEVNNLDLVYDDRQQKILLALGDIKAEGKGEFTADVYDLPLKLEAMISNLTYEDVNYLQNKNFKGETVLNVDMEKMKFAFGDGNFSINDFLFDLTGFIAMPADDIEFDLAFAGKDNTFKSILSLVPGIYTEDFSSLKTSGTMDFKGFFKGIYNDEKFPSFDIALTIADGMFQYPDLPRPVNNVNLDMQIKNATDNLDNTSINIPAFNLDFGSNPISGRLFLANLLDYEIDGALIGKLNLEELTSIFPIEGMALKGVLDVNAQAKGKYDSIAKIIPAIDAKLLLTNGYVKSTEFPAPIEDLQVVATVLNTSGKMDDFVVDLSTFGFELENEAIEGRMKISDFDKLNWDGAVKGAVDLAKILAIFPIEDVTMAGKINADIQTKGSYQAIEEKRYNALDTRGTMAVSDFSYLSSGFPQGVKIMQAKADFTPERVNLSQFNSRLGESPVQATGFMSNYMNYLLTDTETLKGQLNLNSEKFNVNEWMSSAEDTTSSEPAVIELPKNIDFTMSVTSAEVLYDDLDLKDVRGNMILRDGILKFSDAEMQTLGGKITLNGNYDPTDLAAPKFDFSLNLADISISQAFQSFNTIKTFAPIAQHLTGLFNSTIKFSGKLGQDMMPILSSLDGNGLLKIAETALQDSKILDGITRLTKLSDANALLLKNLLISITIDEGVMNVKPFDVKLWDYQANVQGSAGFDGTINYLVNMQVPAGKFGSQANAILATISGTQADENSMIPIALNLTGSYNSPKIALAGGNSIETLLANALKSRASNESEKVQDLATEQFKIAQDSLKQTVQLKASAIQDSVLKEAEKRIGNTQNKAVDDAKTLLKGLLKPKPQPVKPDTTAVKNN
ncbi:MAG: AsmA-like C-terminal region-containing protein [Algoriphagus sp.]|nr:AsmA-like C-terminal region-containing protein [Algoriphagus sp.]